MDWIIVTGLPPYDGRYELDFEKRAARERAKAESAAAAAPPAVAPSSPLSDDSSCPRLAEPAGKRRGTRRRP